MAAWKESDKFKGFEKTQVRIKNEFMNEAMKVMTLKFLNRAPPQPPKSGFAIFLGEKRAAQDGAEGEPSSKKIKREEVVKYKQEWDKLDKLAKSEYDNQRKEKFKAWQEVAKEYMAQDEWKEYVTEAKRLKLPVQSLLSQKKQVIKKLKNGMRFVPIPPRPIDFPSKPPEAFKIFAAEKRGQVPIAEVASLWNGLDAEGKQKYNSEANDLMKKFSEELQAFRASEEGSTYLRKLRIAQRTKRVTVAKFKYLKELPKKPDSALKTYMIKNLASVKAAHPELKGFELRKALEDKWKALTDEEREVFQSEANNKMKEYQESVVAFKASENWQMFTKATKVVRKTKSGKAIPMPPPKPESFPQKPDNAYRQFCRENAGAGKGLAELAKMFAELPPEEKASHNNLAQERMNKYKEEMQAWASSDEGKKYLRAVAATEKRKRLILARERFLKDEPKRPQTALEMFKVAKKAEVKAEFPDLQGALAIQNKLIELFKELGDEDKAAWKTKEQEAKQAYDQAVEEFQKTPGYKRWLLILRGPGGASKAKAKGKGKAKTKSVPMPEPPADMPKKPASSMTLYASEQGLQLAKAAKGWMDLGAEGQKEWNEKYNQKVKEFDAAMKDFMKTAEAKKYFRLKHQAEKRGRLQKAKEKFLGSKGAAQEPKRPQSAYFSFLGEKRAELVAAGKGVGEVAKEVSQMWGAMTPEAKKVYEDRYEEAKQKYEEELKAYKSSDGFKLYERAVRSITATKRPAPKPAGKAGGGKKAEKAAKKTAGGRGKKAGRGRGGAGRGRGAAAAKAGGASSDSASDMMGSDSDSSSSSGSDSD